MSVQHTPLRVVEGGSAEGCRPAVLVGDYVRVIVDCRENFGDPLPLARLIAAAPDLLEALQEVERWIEDNPEPFGQDGREILRLARAALLKARVG